MRGSNVNVSKVLAIVLGAFVGLVILVAVLSWPAMIIFGAFAGYQGWTGPGFFETLFGLLSLTIIGNTFFPSSMRGSK